MRRLGPEPLPRQLSRILPVVFCLPTAVGCAGRSASGPPRASAPEAAPELPGTGETVRLPKGVWFQKDGGLLVVGKAGRVRFELSAPITACGAALEGPYPSAASEREKLASRASLSFVYLRDECIREATANGRSEPSDEQLRQNYLEVAKCANKLGSAPEWFAALVADVDICARALGPSWSLPRHEELDAITAEERTAMAQALFATEPGVGYDSLSVYAREKNGSIATVSLSQSQARVTLRCLRTKPLEPAPKGPAPEAGSCAKSMLARVEPTPPAPPPAPLAPMPPAIARFAEYAKALRTSGPQVDHPTIDREIEAVKAASNALAARVGDTARARREASERYQQAVLAVEEEGVSEAEHERRVQEFKALRKKVEGAEPGPSLSPADARDFSELEGAVKAIEAFLASEVHKVQEEIACNARKCGRVRPTRWLEGELKALEKTKAKLGKLLAPGAPPKK